VPPSAFFTFAFLLFPFFRRASIRFFFTFAFLLFPFFRRAPIRFFYFCLFTFSFLPSCLHPLFLLLPFYFFLSSVVPPSAKRGIGAAVATYGPRRTFEISRAAS
jgi:hypothetical protein